MLNRRFDWHEHIKDIEREYQTARLAVDRLKQQVAVSPEMFSGSMELRPNLRATDNNLEGTYLVRLFAAFEAALRSFDRARHDDGTRTLDAAVLIDSTAGRRGQGISTAIRSRAHEVRLVRNYWAHESDELPSLLTLAQARSRLQEYLSWLPAEWG